MKNVNLLAALALLIFGLGVNALASEGGTKLIATVARPEQGQTQFGPIWVVGYDELTPSKPVMQLLRRFPKPTLSIENLREEKGGPSLGTKAVVLFQE